MEPAEPDKPRQPKPRHARAAAQSSAAVLEHARLIMIAAAVECAPRIGDAFSLTAHLDLTTDKVLISISQTGRGRTPLLTHHGGDDASLLSRRCRSLLKEQGKEAAKISWIAGQRGSLSIKLLDHGSRDAAHAKTEIRG